MLSRRQIVLRIPGAFFNLQLSNRAVVLSRRQIVPRISMCSGAFFNFQLSNRAVEYSGQELLAFISFNLSIIDHFISCVDFVTASESCSNSSSSSSNIA